MRVSFHGKSQDTTVKTTRQEVGRSAPFLETSIFDWDAITAIDADRVERTADVQTMSEVVSAFVLCDLVERDYNIVGVPIVFHLLRLLQMSLKCQMNDQKALETKCKQLEDEVDDIRCDYKTALLDIKRMKRDTGKWKQSSRCPVCNAVFESKSAVDKHMEKFHGHVLKEWKSVIANEPDKSAQCEIENLKMQVFALKRQLREHNTSVIPFKRNKHNHDESTVEAERPLEAVSSRRPLARSENMSVSIAPNFDANEPLIPASVQRKVDEYFHPIAKKRPKNDESVEAVADRITRMLKANPEAVVTERERIRQQSDETVRRTHRMPTVHRPQLHYCGESMYFAVAAVSSAAADDDSSLEQYSESVTSDAVKPDLTDTIQAEPADSQNPMSTEREEGASGAGSGSGSGRQRRRRSSSKKSASSRGSRASKSSRASLTQTT